MHRLKSISRRFAQREPAATARRIEREIDEELSFHLHMRTRENIAAGMTPDEARRQARARLGELDGVRTRGRGIRRAAARWSMIARLTGDLGQDLRFAARSMARSPAPTAIALLALTLGIGATTAIFTVVNGVLLEEFPYENPDRIVSIHGRAVDVDGEGGTVLDEHLASLSQTAFYTIDSPELVGPKGAIRGASLPVSEGFFPLLGARASIGRTLVADDFRAAAPAVVVVTDRFWEQSLGSRVEAIGETLLLDGQAHEIVGVMPPGFTMLMYSRRDLFVPIGPDPGGVMMLGRLQDGVPFEQAREEAVALAATLDLDLREGQPAIYFYSLYEAVVGGDRADILILAGAVGLVLLIACANVAGLSLARALSRRSEIAVRTALGAGKARLARQLLTEGGLLALTGGAAGTLLSLWSVPLLMSLSPAYMARIENVEIDLRVLAFTAAVSLAVGVLTGLAPVVFAKRNDLRAAMAGGDRHSGRSRRGSVLLTGLVVGEIALCLALLVASGLLARAFLDIHPSSPGFDPSGKLALEVRLPETRYPDAAARAAYYERAIDELRALPGVADAAAISSPPLVGMVSPATAIPEGRNADDEDLPSVWLEHASANYHRLMEIALVAGRSLSATPSPAVDEIVLSETAARRLFADADPLGRRVTLRGWTGEGDYVVVGIGADTRRLAGSKAPRPTAWIDFRSGGDSRMTYLLQARTRPEALAGPVRDVLAALDARLPIEYLRTMDSIVYESSGTARFYAVLMSTFGGIAILLATIGFYGMLAFSIGRRTRELGLRVALGATPATIRAMVLRQAGIVVATGIGLGLAASLGVGRALESRLYDISPTDPLIYLGLAGFVAFVGLLATLLPARRATRVDPLTALRQQ